MFNFSKKQFVFKQASGSVWNFYFEQYQGICYCNLTKRNTWTEAISLQKNVLPSFFADMDTEDCFHLLYQDVKGNIFYTTLRDTIHTLPILTNRTPSNQNRHLFLLPSKNSTQIFFVLPHNNAYILAQQTVRDKKIGAPVVVDYLLYSQRPFTILKDRVETLYAFYHSSDGKYSQIGFKKLLPGNEKWSEYVQVSRHEGNCQYLSALIDSENIIHLSYQRSRDKQNELVYQQKVPDRNLWTPEIVIHTSSQSFENSSLVLINSTLILYWVREDIIFYSTSGDRGSTWSKPLRFNFQSAKQLLCIGYKTNFPSESEKIAGDTFAGSFVNGLKLAFYQDPSHTSLTTEELRSLLVDGMRLLKGSVEDLKDKSTQARNDISLLEKSMESLQRDLVKYSLKLGMLENDLDNLKIHNHQMEKYFPLLETLAQEELTKNKESTIETTKSEE